MSWTKKNIVPKKLFKVGDIIECVITEIDEPKRRVAISHKLTIDNPYETFEKAFPEGSEVDGIISSINEYALYIKLDKYDIDGFCHANNIIWLGNPEEELKKYKGDKLTKVLEIKKNEQKVTLSLKHLYRPV